MWWNKKYWWDLQLHILKIISLVNQCICWMKLLLQSGWTALWPRSHEILLGRVEILPKPLFFLDGWPINTWKSKMTCGHWNGKNNTKCCNAISYLKKILWKNLTRLLWSSWSEVYSWRDVSLLPSSLTVLEGMITRGSVSPTNPHLWWFYKDIVSGNFSNWKTPRKFGKTIELLKRKTVLISILDWSFRTF